ncbi:MAG: hypothetical protein RR548_02055 [Carnobacterium sp.]|uniref:Resolvase HTH domain-containing protein n=1 Tax=Carnobacterium antarcticum TaxID=2126436 RepID=A0ABW4NPI4_9LACT|nr:MULTISPECIES: hypothetical protein [unclassified Carnobacterium]ALV21309.1 hypothetical protein NY10_691 [Carnobacterium sp. CP1]QQP69331.1 hypothetical protein JHE06_06625 [Carnobacterium sp. CS13]
MDLWVIVIVLLAIAIGLIGWSFYKKDNGEKIKEEFEELSLQLLQDIFQLKKRVSVLEKELNIHTEEIATSAKIHDVLKKHVITLYTQGVAIEDIANQTRLSEATIKVVVDEYLENN